MLSSHAARLVLSLALLTAPLPTWAGFKDFNIPPSDATVDVKAFSVANFTLNNLTSVFLNPVLPGREDLTLPIHAFLVEHKPSKESFMFDLGMRKDPENLPPAFAGFFTSKAITFDAFKDITDLLKEGGVSLNSIKTVFWSHAHFDHIGDMSKFPKGTKIVVGSKTDTSIFPDNPNSDLQASDLDGKQLVKLDFDKSKLTIGGLKAIDQFGDGSFYLLDTPGHLSGHMTALARTTPTSFILLGGDTLHHVGQLRPTAALQSTVPCPGDLLASTRTAISTSSFWSVNSTPGAFDLPSRAQPFFALSDVAGSFYADPGEATISVAKFEKFDADKDFLTIVAHDASVGGVLPLFPESLSTWQEDGLKEKMAWLFLDERNEAFELSPVSANDQPTSSLDEEYTKCVQQCSANAQKDRRMWMQRRSKVDWDMLMEEE
ncbi:Metallo-beta-lactamase superfamily protein [Favolaschia claudopus]|uniref:Metallo-beta-lactamase superfamily protein n=1 Tax=Favolaschia claudopus TaxID=2862362 RepID=A0AAW0E2Y4_9AGAR